MLYVHERCTLMWNENGGASSSSAWSLKNLSWKVFLAAESVFFLAWGIIDLKEVGNQEGDPLLPPIVPGFTFLIIGTYLLLKVIGYHGHPRDHKPSASNLPSSVWGWTKAVTWLLLFGVPGAVLSVLSAIDILVGFDKQPIAPLAGTPVVLEALVLATVGPHLMLIGAQNEDKPVYCLAFAAFIVSILLTVQWLLCYSALVGGAGAILVASLVRKHYGRAKARD